MSSVVLQGGLGLSTLLVGLLFLTLAIVVVYQSVEIVDAYEKKTLTVFGEYRRLLEPGISFIWPFVSRTYAFDMRTQTLDVPRQEAITRDNSPVTADAVVYIKVMNAKKAFLEVDDYKNAVSQGTGRAHRRVGDPCRERRGSGGQPLEGCSTRHGATDLRRAKASGDDPRGTGRTALGHRAGRG